DATPVSIDRSSQAGPYQYLPGASEDGYRYIFTPSVDAAAVNGLLSVSSQNPSNVPLRSGKPCTYVLLASPNEVSSILSVVRFNAHLFSFSTDDAVPLPLVER